MLFFYQLSGIGFTLNGVSYTNNSIVTITEIGTGSAALNCITTYEEAKCCFSTYGGTNGWFFPNGSEVKNNANLSYYRNRARDPGTVLLRRNPEGTTTGIFHCDIPATSISDIQSLYVGIYSSTTGTPTTTALVYNQTTRSLTCTSTGGPATTVTWRKDGAVITINETYQQTQVVTNTTTGTYQTVLTIGQSVSDISGIYSCTVNNTRGTSSAINTTGEQCTS